jgi:hypothetical protein
MLDRLLDWVERPRSIAMQAVRLTAALAVACVIFIGPIVGLAYAWESIAPCTAKEPGQCPMYCTGYKGQTYICGWMPCEDCVARRWYWEHE